MYAKLSTKQKKILDKKGKFVVRACPGSGKTYCVSAKLAKLISEWKLTHQGVATISFTNTAWQEIGKKCEEDFNTKVAYPHFLGTIDSFINQFIFLPFGHLILGCNKRPIMVGEPYGVWGGGTNEQDPNYYFDKVSYDVNGKLCRTKNGVYFLSSFPDQYTKAGTENKNFVKLRAMKESLLKKGYSTQADANYFAMLLLEKYPIVRKSLATKFPWLIIDEAQDTTEIQMKIIDHLVSENKDQNIMLVGDPDQAIFEWNNARPELFTEKQKLWEANSIIFDESWRSSQKICDVVHSLSSLGDNKIIAAKPTVKDFGCDPEICIYEEGKRKETIDKFISKCAEHDVEVTPKSAVILARAKGFFTGKFPNIIPWVNSSPYTRDFAIGKYLIDRKDFVRGIKYIERGYINFTENIHYCSDKELKDYSERKGFIEFNKVIKEFISLLPETNVNLGVWITTTESNFATKSININLSYNNAAKDFPFKALFPQEFADNLKLPYRLSTIHKVKGETFEAVLIFLKKKVAKNYKTMLETSTVSEEEELRNIYVAISRPTKILMLAVPDEEDKKCWTSKLLPTAQAANSIQLP